MELNRAREPHSLFKSAVALLLIIGCLWAAQWQYHRGVNRHHRNVIAQAHIGVKALPISQVGKRDESTDWRRVLIRGTFDGEVHKLLRNKYSEGVYGFEILFPFTSASGEKFWVNVGWVKAGETAQTPPVLPVLPHGPISLLGRLRTTTDVVKGSYVELISIDGKPLTSAVPVQLPEFSDGPHFAYSVQWLFFAGLVIYGRFLIRRDVLSRKEL